MDFTNPLLAKATVSADRQPSPSSERDKPTSQRSVPGAIKTLIGEIGLRYRPSAQADLEEHAAGLALLACDVAELSPELLRSAIRQHVAQSPYMPKASELIALARAAGERRSKANPADVQRLHDYAAKMNDQKFVQAYGWEYFVSELPDGRATLAKREKFAPASRAGG